MVEIPTAPAPPPRASETLFAGCLVLLPFSVVAVIAAAIAFHVLTESAPNFEAPTAFYSRAHNIATELGIFCALPVCIFAIWRVAGRFGAPRRDLLALRLPSWSQALFWALALAALEYAHPYGVDPRSFPIREYLLPLLWLTMVVAEPLFGQLFFSGLFLGGLARSRMGVWWALVWTSLLFAVLSEPKTGYAFGYYLALAALCGAARFVAGSTYLAMGLHSAANFVLMIRLALHLHAPS